jgi:hypothetical protein
MKTKIVRIVFCVGALCTNNVPPAISRPGAPRETSTALTSKDPSKTYFSLKRSFKEVPAKYLRDKGKPIKLVPRCISAADLYGTNTGKRLPLTSALSELAFEILWIDGSLKRGRYPSNLWTSDLSTIEHQALDRLRNWNWKTLPRELIPEASLVALAQKMDKYRKDNHETIPVLFQPPGICAFTPPGPFLDIRTTPAAKQVQYMSEHFADLCADQGFNFSDNRCNDYWQDYNGKMMLHGRLIFVVRWASGPPAYRRWNLDKMESQDGSIRLEVSQ